MDILIKSFNRAYYLDRCLFSIEKHVKNFDGKIVVLDDGTPQEFLDKLVLKYPKIAIKKSKYYEEKQRCTKNGIRPSEYVIPIDLWLENAKNASNNFLLLEDDTWFIDDLDFNEIETEIRDNNVVLTKLFWIGNSKINVNKVAIPKKHIVIIKPKLYTIIPALYTFIFYKFDKFKIRKILRFFKIYTDDKRLAYYTIYATAGVIFNRDYFCQLWDNHQNKIDENLQVYNAIKAYKKYDKKKSFAHYNREILKTGFISSATNQFKEQFEGDIDMFQFNKLLNEAWCDNTFNTISSLPYDIPEKDVIHVLNSNPQNSISAGKWISWIKDFKNQYTSIGCVID